VRAVVQRVHEADVVVDGQSVGAIGYGLLVLLAVEHSDGSAEATRMAARLAGLRVLTDETGKMNRSILDAGAGILVVSNFTVCADTQKGNRPSFNSAAPPAKARLLYEQVVTALGTAGCSDVHTGRFGATMDVRLRNDGPVTIVLDVRPPQEKAVPLGTESA
jgi:D-aminoacyl-tRNA deacylase